MMTISINNCKLNILTTIFDIILYLKCLNDNIFTGENIFRFLNCTKSLIIHSYTCNLLFIFDHK